VTIQVQIGGEPMLIETVDGAARARRGEAAHPDGVLRGAPRLVFGVLSGSVELAEAEGRGLEYEGDPRILSRFRGKESDLGTELVP
jgi:hypothetical protein